MRSLVHVRRGHLMSFFVFFDESLGESLDELPGEVLGSQCSDLWWGVCDEIFQAETFQWASFKASLQWEILLQGWGGNFTAQGCCEDFFFLKMDNFCHSLIKLGFQDCSNSEWFRVLPNWLSAGYYSPFGLALPTREPRLRQQVSNIKKRLFFKLGLSLLAWQCYTLEFVGSSGRASGYHGIRRWFKLSSFF